MEEDFRDKLDPRFNGRLGVSTTTPNKKKGKQFQTFKKFQNKMEWAQLEQISCKVRVIKREMETLEQAVRGRKHSNVTPKVGHSTCYQTTVDDLRDIQELIASLQIGFDRLKMELK